MITKRQLKHFIRVRNKSGFASNLQFISDAMECGFRVEELGQGYQWPMGYYFHAVIGREARPVTLIEQDGTLRQTPGHQLPHEFMVAA